MNATASLLFVLVLTGGLSMVFAILAGIADYLLPALAAASRRRTARQIRAGQYCHSVYR